MHKIFARANAKLRSKLFTRIGKEIAMAVKAGGPNPDSNSRLKMAIQNARGMNMPKDNVDRAIKKAAGGEGRRFRGSDLRGLRTRRCGHLRGNGYQQHHPYRGQCAQLLQQV
jgi:hypothetical protein